jgi:hypothetical protein
VCPAFPARGATGVASGVADTAQGARLDEVPFPSLSALQVAALVDRHKLGIGAEEVRPLRSTGIAHTVYALGDHFVLRVPKAHPEAVADTYTGSVAAPVAHAAGVRTPALVVFDNQRDIAPVPLSVFQRAAGDPLVHLGAHPQDMAPVWLALGRDLAVLHGGVTVCDDPHGRLDSHDHIISEHQELLAELRRSGVIGEDAASWLMAVLSRLRPAAEDRGRYRRFVHGDVQPSNVLGRRRPLQRHHRLGRRWLVRPGGRLTLRASTSRRQSPGRLPGGHAPRRGRFG